MVAEPVEVPEVPLEQLCRLFPPNLFRLPPADVGLVPVGTAMYVDAEFQDFSFFRNIFFTPLGIDI